VSLLLVSFEGIFAHVYVANQGHLGFLLNGVGQLVLNLSAIFTYLDPINFLFENGGWQEMAIPRNLPLFEGFVLNVRRSKQSPRHYKLELYGKWSESEKVLQKDSSRI
jgi:hypothetical protein